MDEERQRAIVQAAIGVVGLAIVVVLLMWIWSKNRPELTLDLVGTTVRLTNTSGGAWNNVELWANDYYRALVPTLQNRQTVNAPLDVFIDAYARRFDPQHDTVRKLEIRARRADGTSLEFTWRRPGR